MLFVPNKNLLEDLPILAYCKDSNGIYSYCNSYMAQSLDFTDARELIGKSDFELMWSEHAKKIRYTDLQVVTQNKIMIIDLKMENYQEILNSDKVVILDFYLIPCGPCDSMLTELERIDNKYDDKITIVKIDSRKMEFEELVFIVCAS